ncbi:MAG: SDR family oxidoreductase [Planctomycetaceae bacterium]|jgi:enoyl-[acyl-carrier protein] reductase III|nr:MAG: SDR family oxidoreductase [Planctomycetaceae bacterium]
MIDLSGQVALVTGASRGIGRACALRLAEAGADIVVNYVSSKSSAMEVAEAIRRMGRNAAVIRADISERDDVESMIEFIKLEFGSLAIVVSNAATGGFRPLVATTDRNFDAAMHINVRPVLYLVQAALPLLEQSEGRAKVIAISSHGSVIALPMYGTIGTSKAALEALMRHMALELGERGINFNTVRAGLVETDSTRRIPNSEAIFAGRIHKSMTGHRFLTDRDVADAVLYLASPLSDLVQGETLVVDGGVGIHV